MARVQVSLSGSTTEITANNTIARATRWLVPESFGAKGDGITDDTAAIQAALDAAQGEIPVVLTGGNTYRCETIVPTYDHWHLIIDPGATLKANDYAGNGAYYNGIVYLTKKHGCIENYGIIDGNAEAPPDTLGNGAFTGLLTTFETTCEDFYYTNHGVGVIRSAPYTAMVLDFCVRPFIDGAIFEDGHGLIQDLATAQIQVQATEGARIHDVYIRNCTTLGIKVFSNTPTYYGFEIDNVTVDYRGFTYPTSAEICLGVELFGELTDLTVSNVKVFAPEAFEDANQQFIGVSMASANRMTATNMQSIGSTATYNSLYALGMEFFSQEGVASGCVVESWYNGIHVGAPDGKIKITVKNTNAWGIGIGRRTDVDASTVDCAVTGDAVLTLATFVSLTGETAAHSTVKLNAYYSSLAQNVSAFSCQADYVTLYDSKFVNEMGNYFVHVGWSEGANGAAILNSSFINQGDVGTAIKLNGGAGNRIIGNHFKDYSQPWDTSASSNTLIMGNLVESCITSSGAVAGTDTAVNNKAF